MPDLTAEQVNAELEAHAGVALAGRAGNAEAAKAEAEKAATDKAAADAAAAKGSGEGAKGNEGKGDDGGYKNPSDAKNFRALREVTELLKGTAEREKERADRLEKELATLRTPPAKDPTEDLLEKMDPAEKERLQKTGVLPLLLEGIEARKEASALKGKVAEIDSDRQTRAQKEQGEKMLLSAIAEYGNAENLEDAYLDQIVDVVAEGKVAGKTYRDLLTNAREVLDLRLKAKGAGAGGKGGDEAALARAAAKAAAGGADASAGSAAPAATGSRKELMGKYEELRGNDPAEADRILITALTRPGDLRKMPAGLLSTK